MSDVPDSSAPDTPSTTEQVTDDVPLARPITLPQATPRPEPADEWLLTRTTAGAACADLVRLVVYFLLLNLLAELALGELVNFDWGSASEDDPLVGDLRRAMLLPLLAFRAGATLLIVSAILRYRRQSFRSVGVHRDTLGRNILIGLGTTIVVYGLIMLVTPLMWMIWPDLWDLMTENAERIQNLVPRLHPVGFAAVALTVGVYEEVLFRGFLMTRLRRVTGSWAVAVILNTVLFTALHAVDQTAPALVAVTILSLSFSLVTVWRRSIIPAIVAHTVFDLIQLLWLTSQAGDAWQ